MTGSAKTCQIFGEIYFLIYFGRRISLKQDDFVFTDLACSITKIIMAADKQRVNEAIVEKLCSKLDFRLLEAFSVFLRKFLTSLNNS